MSCAYFIWLHCITFSDSSCKEKHIILSCQTWTRRLSKINTFCAQLTFTWLKRLPHHMNFLKNNNNILKKSMFLFSNSKKIALLPQVSKISAWTLPFVLFLQLKVIMKGACMVIPFLIFVYHMLKLFTWTNIYYFHPYWVSQKIKTAAFNL